VDALGQAPSWLEAPVRAVMADLHGALPIAGLVAAVALVDGLNGVSLFVIDGAMSMGPLPRLAEAEDLNLEPTGIPGGGNFVPRGLAGPELVAWVAEILQEDLAETEVAWGQARPPCPYHPHPALPAGRDGEAWWVCERLDEPLYPIGQGKVPTRQLPPTSWPPGESRRKAKRRQGRGRPQ
jgi:hypothetical protein